MVMSGTLLGVRAIGRPQSPAKQWILLLNLPRERLAGIGVGHEPCAPHLAKPLNSIKHSLLGLRMSRAPEVR